MIRPLHIIYQFPPAPRYRTTPFSVKSFMEFFLKCHQMFAAFTRVRCFRAVPGLWNCCMSPYRPDYITILYRIPRTSDRLVLLLSDSRCSFLFRGLDQDCLFEIFPEFTWLFKTHYCVRPLILSNGNVFWLQSVCCRKNQADNLP